MSDKIRVSLQPTQVEMEADGEPQELVLYVQNVGEYVDQYNIEVEGLDPRWFTLPLVSVSLFPPDHEDIKLQLHPRTAEGARAGSYPFRVTVTSRTAPAESTVVAGELTIRAYAVFAAEVLPPTKISCRRKADFRLKIINRGNVEIALAPQAVDREEGCRFAFIPPQPRVPAGTPPPTQEVRLVARPKRSFWVGPEKNYDLTITLAPAGAKGEAKTLPAQVVHRPLLPSWRPVIQWGRRFVVLAALVIMAFFGVQVLQNEGGLAAAPTVATRWAAQLRTSLQDALGLGHDQTTGTPGSAGTVPTRTPTPAPAGTAVVPSAGPGLAPAFAPFAKAADPKLLGAPVEAATTDKDGNVHQATANGLLVWWKYAETAYFFSKAGLIYEFKNNTVTSIGKVH